MAAPRMQVDERAWTSMWRKLLSYEYLLEPIPGQPGPLRFLYLLLAAGTLLSLGIAYGLSREQRPRVSRRALLLETFLTAAGLLFLLCSFAGVPYLSMRLLVFGANLAAWWHAAWLWIRQREPLDLWGRQRLACRGQVDLLVDPLPRHTFLGMVGIHLLGLLGLARHYQWPWWSPLLIIPLALSPQLLGVWHTRRLLIHLEALTPLCLIYALLAMRLLVLAAAKLLAGYPHFFLPALWDVRLNVDFAVATGLTWSVSAQLYAMLHQRRRANLLAPTIVAALLLLTCSWAAYTYVHLRTHGVTGSDPYCYAQMGVDWVKEGVPVHRFPLVRTMQQLGVLAEAGVHLGYHLPFGDGGQAATVWPIGQACLLAVGYAVAGEVGLYVTTPVVGLLSLAALTLLSSELLTAHALGDKLLVTAIAVFVLATSYAQLERLVVPMADAAAQLFTTLTVWLWLRAMRCSRALLWAGLAGASLALAYWIRHTQVVLGVSMLLFLGLQPISRRRKAAMLAAFAAVAVLLAIPDLCYHQWVRGYWLRPESLELRHFDLLFMGKSAARMCRELLSTREFLYLGPFLVWGIWRHAQSRRVQFALLGTWAAGVTLLHLPYEALRLRDLLSIFPVLCWWVGYGVLETWHWVELKVRGLLTRGRLSKYGLGLACAWLLMLVLLARTGSTLMLFRATDFDAFGRLNPQQRVGFAQIGQQTEADALIGASLNSGSLELHSGRTSFRPAVWQKDELYTFLDYVMSQGTPVYLLQDGLEMAAPLAAARQRYELSLVDRYDIPFYYTGGGSSGALVPLYQLQLKG